MSLTALWSRLQTVRSFDLLIRHPLTAIALHQAAGAIEVEAANDVTLWRETGRWFEGRLAGIHFTNTTRWELEADGRLRVSHQRRGPEPTLLSVLEPSGPGEWNGPPHLCGADLYFPHLRLTDRELRMTWQVTSPTDPYHWELSAR